MRTIPPAPTSHALTLTRCAPKLYAAMLAGAAGHGYGSLDLFYFYKDADGPFPKNGFQHWRTAVLTLVKIVGQTSGPMPLGFLGV